MSNTESEPYETPEEIRSRIVRGYLTDNGIAPTKQDAEIASLQQQLSDCKSALRAVEANCDCKQINELAGMVGMKFVSWKAKAEVAEAERDEARRQRNDIRKAWEGADARAKAAEQELAEARAMIESRERNWLASVENEVAANRKLAAAEAERDSLKGQLKHLGQLHEQEYRHQVAAREAVEAEREALKTYAFEATKAITNLTCGGSEFFSKRIGDMYTADLPYCVQFVRERDTRAHERWLKESAARKAAEAREKQLRAETIEECAKVAEATQGVSVKHLRRETAFAIRVLATKEAGNG